MKVLKCLIAFSLAIFMFSCSSEETRSLEDGNSLEDLEISTRNTNCTSPLPVDYTINGSQITVNSISDPNVNFIAIHKASNFAFVEALCDYWNGGAPPCGSNLTSSTLADDDYLLKVSTNSGFCWVPFTTPELQPCDPVSLTSSGGTITISCIDASVTRLDIHNLDFSAATPVSSICNAWSTSCNAPLTVSGFSTGSRLLRIETSSGVTFEPITIN